jgi:hypothetical protein
MYAANVQSNYTPNLTHTMQFNTHTMQSNTHTLPPNLNQSKEKHQERVMSSNTLFGAGAACRKQRSIKLATCFMSWLYMNSRKAA